MKKNILALLACAAMFSFTACEDYNQDNFGIDNDANIITDVANYKTDYDGEYPNSEYFVSKPEVETSLNEWLKDKYYACDLKSTAEVSKVMFSETKPEEAIEVNVKDTLQTDDYVAMGTGYGEPGKYKNFDKNMDMNFYINAYLNNKYPYKKDNTVAGVAIDYYVGGKGKTNDSTFVFKKENNVWSLQNVREIKTTTGTGDDAVITYSWMLKERVEIATRVAQMEKQVQGWKLLRLIGGSKKFVLDNTHYQLLVDKTIDRIAKNEINGKYMDQERSMLDEFYYGSSAQYNNINQKYYTWRQYYNPADADASLVNYDNLSDEQLQELMDNQLAEGIMNVLLPVLVDTPDSGLSYIIVYKVYGDKAGDFAMSFMYNEQDATWERTAGPVIQ
jgi:hypothetical protein